MVSYGPWVQEPTREFIRSDTNDTDSGGVQNAGLFRGHTSQRGHFAKGNTEIIDTEIAEHVLPPLFAAGDDSVPTSSNLWALSYDYWCSLSDDPLRFHTSFHANAVSNWTVTMLPDPIAHGWRHQIETDAGNAGAFVEWHPDDHYHGLAANRRLSVRHSDSSGTVTVIRPSEATAAGTGYHFGDPGEPSFGGPGTLTNVRVINPLSLPLWEGVPDHDVYYYHSLDVADNQQAVGLGFLPGDIGAGQIRFDPTCELYGWLPEDAWWWHGDAGNVRTDPLDDPSGEVYIGSDGSIADDRLAWRIRDYPYYGAAEPTSFVKGYMVTLAPRVLTVYSAAGLVDWPDMAGAGNAVRTASVSATLEYVCDWTPPRYRLVYAAVPGLPPTRVFPRDDGLLTASAGRVWPPPRSQQGSPRAGPGSYS